MQLWYKAFHVPFVDLPPCPTTHWAGLRKIEVAVGSLFLWTLIPRVIFIKVIFSLISCSLWYFSRASHHNYLAMKWLNKPSSSVDHRLYNDRNLLIIINIPYFREYFPRKLFFFESRKFSYSFRIMAILYFINWISSCRGNYWRGELFKGGNYSRKNGIHKIQ